MTEGWEAREARLKAEHNQRMRIWRSILVTGLAILILLPVGAVVTYQFGGTFTNQVYPLQQANAWLNAAESYVPYNPSAALNDTLIAQHFVEQSDNASGLGLGSPYWLWPTADTTYEYVYSLFGNVESAIVAYNASSGLFHNTTITSWNQVTNAMTTIQTSIVSSGHGVQNSIAGGIFYGNVMSIAESLVFIFTGIASMVVLVGLEPKKQR